MTNNKRLASSGAPDFAFSGDCPTVADRFIDYINIWGSRSVYLEPIEQFDECHGAMTAIEGIDRWAEWWMSVNGQLPRLLPRRIGDFKPTMATELFGPRRSPSAGRFLGINVGGSILRVVLRDHHRVETLETIYLGNGRNSILRTLDVNDFLEMLPSSAETGPLDGVGFAWAAPLRRSKVVPVSQQASCSPEIEKALRGEDFRVMAEGHFDAPISFWNDGDAVAFAESRDASGRNLVLKWGTSVAAGVADGNSLLEAPIEIAKCRITPRSKSRSDEKHPVAGIGGTLRDTAGATALVNELAEKKSEIVPFSRFESLVETEDNDACTALGTACEALASVVNTVCEMTGATTLILTGSNLRTPAVQNLTLKHVRSFCPTLTVRESILDVESSAAAGASFLAESHSSGDDL